jgi:hypothetical protein
MRVSLLLGVVLLWGCASSTEPSGSSAPPSPSTIQLNCEPSGAVGTPEYERCAARTRAGVEGAAHMLRLQ